MHRRDVMANHFAAIIFPFWLLVIYKFFLDLTIGDDLSKWKNEISS
jgi:hypothetical protein